MMCDDSYGMTLIELIATLAIVGILACFSVPWLFSETAHHVIQERKKELTYILSYARMQAFLREETLILAPLNINLENNWSDGLRLYVQDGKTLPPKNKHTLHEWHWSNSQFAMFWFGFQSKNYILVDADSSKLAMNGYFLIKKKQDTLSKMNVNRFGQVRYSN
jgi:prepilin-type N-terminal cleavage/methylation domain-containing protein